MTALMWTATGWAAVLPILMVALGQLSWRRDIFLLLVYVQAIGYVHVGPTLSAADLDVATQARYAEMQWLALALFELPLLLVYWILVRRPLRRRTATLGFSASRATLLAAGSLLLGIGYVAVSLRSGLLYRRIGEQIATAQLQLDLASFAVYRGFLEAGLFLVAALYVYRRLPGQRPRRTRVVLLAGLWGTLGCFALYALVNSRLTALLICATLYGVHQLTDRTPARGIRLARAATIGLVLAAAAYGLAVVSNVRDAYSRGRPVVDVRNLVPQSSRDATIDRPTYWRLNGLDIIVLISDNVRRDGPAYGTAWAVPFVVSLDPIVRTPLTVQLKEAALTTSKSFLMLRYAGVARTDYYSCMLTDAYGNFAEAGFLIAAIVLAVALALSTRALVSLRSPAAIVVAVFVVTRLLPFEQEFGTVLYGWLKLAPGVLVLALWSPLRRMTPEPPPAPRMVAAPSPAVG